MNDSDGVAWWLHAGVIWDTENSYEVVSAVRMDNTFLVDAHGLGTYEVSVRKVSNCD